jgi:hypothetical protein
MRDRQTLARCIGVAGRVGAAGAVTGSALTTPYYAYYNASGEGHGFGIFRPSWAEIALTLAALIGR